MALFRCTFASLMKKILFIFFALTTFVNTIQASGVKGQVIEGTGDPIPYAAVAVMNLDSQLVGGVATDLEGRFNIPLEQGTYKIRVQFLSMQDLWLNEVEVKGWLDLGQLTLTPSALDLEGVEIQAERSYMEMELDKRVFHVGKDVSSHGANATQVLEQIPAVQVDVEGNVSLRGSDNVRIMIDGKPVEFTGGDAATVLKLIPGNTIEKVEMITNPSARYDASGEVGIINIVLKEERRKGLTGSWNVKTGYPYQAGTWGNLDFRKGKWTLFTSAGIDYRERWGAGGIDMRFTYPDTTYGYTRDRNHSSSGYGYNGKIGVAYDWKKQNLSVTASLRNNHSDNLVENQYNDWDALNNRVGGAFRTENEIEDRTRPNVSFNYRRTYEQEGREWTARGRVSMGGSEVSSVISEVNENNAIAPIDQSSFNNRNNFSWLLKTDYVHPVDSSLKWEAGGQASHRINGTDFGVSFLNEGVWESLPKFTNDITYEEIIYAGYLLGAKTWKKWSFQTGLRMEYTDLNTYDASGELNNRRIYPGWFPSGHVTYKLPKRQSLQASYSRRIDRPHFWHLIPFFNFPDSRNLFSGNPNLNPNFTNAFELNYLRNFDKGSLTVQSFYRKSKGVVTFVQLQDSADFTRMFPINLGSSQNAGFDLSGDYRPNKVWTFRGSVSGYYSITDGEYEGQDFYAEAFQWNTSLNTMARFENGWRFQYAIWYRAPFDDIQGRERAVTASHGTVAKEFWKSKGTLSLSVWDLFNTNRHAQYIETETFTSEGWFRWQQRTFTLTFTYLINPEQGRNRRANGGEQEQEFQGGY